jgi:hypothetical protein
MMVSDGLPHLLPAEGAQRVVGAVSPIAPAALGLAVADEIYNGFFHAQLEGLV